MHICSLFPRPFVERGPGNEASTSVNHCNGLCRCTCLAGQLSARVSCEIAEDEDFCQCVVANFGDENQVCSSYIVHSSDH